MKLRKSAEKIIKYTVSMLSLLFWLLIIFGFNIPYIAVLTVISALIHEIGHIIPLIIMGKYRKNPHSTICGFRIKVPELLSYDDSIIVLLSGPLANIAVFIICYLLSLAYGEYFLLFAILNLVTAISNLIPVKSYDGYKILQILLSYRGLSRIGHMVCEYISFTIVCFMTFISLYLILKVGDGYWIFSIFFISLLVSIFKSKTFQK